MEPYPKDIGMDINTGHPLAGIKNPPGITIAEFMAAYPADDYLSADEAKILAAAIPSPATAMAEAFSKSMKDIAVGFTTSMVMVKDALDRLSMQATDVSEVIKSVGKTEPTIFDEIGNFGDVAL